MTASTDTLLRREVRKEVDARARRNELVRVLHAKGASLREIAGVDGRSVETIRKVIGRAEAELRRDG